MDKKQASKSTNEVSVAVAEASPTEVDGSQQQQQPHTPRRRGRPRKNKIETNMGEMKTGEESQQVSETQEFMKKPKSGEVEEVQEKQEEAKADSNKEDLIAKRPSRSRARKKGKPRKSC